MMRRASPLDPESPHTSSTETGPASTICSIIVLLAYPTSSELAQDEQSEIPADIRATTDESAKIPNPTDSGSMEEALGFFDLPAELRLAIYENFKRCSHHTPPWRQNHLVIASTGKSDAGAIAALSRTCKQAYGELAKLHVLYDRTFEIRVTNVPGNLSCLPQQPVNDYSLARFAPRVCMSLDLCQDHGEFYATLLTAEKVLEMLRGSSQLEHLNFHAGLGTFDRKNNLGDKAGGKQGGQEWHES
ncbi:hypothetical protein LTR37_019612 [Vermiconidia calcicola]|uniref:Uncharacterized protein n=1 Tax=Vermiconidia calcicola TaxID=1690605 RepID=A0ACC3MER6_9PEZI|nr:hypothetical protein LTR37_019612 [Vermiconidia calcicola]